MIHLAVWLAGVTSRSFALFLVIVVSVAAWYGGAIGRGLLAAFTGGSLLFYVAPAAAHVALGYLGVGAVITLAAGAAARLLAPLTTRDHTSYVKAVRAGKTQQWWQPTLLDRLLDRRYLQPWPDDPTASVDHDAVAALHAMYAARREATGDPLKAPRPATQQPVTPPNNTPPPAAPGGGRM